MSKQNRAYCFALTAVLLWSTVATAFKLTLRHCDPLQMLFYACLTSTVALALILLLQGRLQTLVGALADHWRTTVIAALLNPAIYYVVLFAAYDRLPAQVAQPINYTWAIVLTFLSILVLKQRVSMQDICAAFICYGGVAIVATQGDVSHLEQANWVGIALALAPTVIWATYWIVNIRDERRPDVGLCLNFLVALPMIAVVCAAFSDFGVTMPGLLGSIYIGLIEMALPFLAWSHALKLSVNTSRVSNLIFLSPFLSLVLIHHVLGEAIHATTYVGLVLIVAGLLFQQHSARHAPV